MYNVSEGGTAMLRVVLNTTTDRTITVAMTTQNGTAFGKLQITVNTSKYYMSTAKLV